MVYINNQHINRKAPDGAYGGAMCCCPKCVEERAKAKLEDKSDCEGCRAKDEEIAVLNRHFVEDLKDVTELEDEIASLQQQLKEKETVLSACSRYCRTHRSTRQMAQGRVG